MDDALADEIAKRAAPVYYITGTIHSTEAGAPTALMELAYRLAVDDSAYIRNILREGITNKRISLIRRRFRGRLPIANPLDHLDP